MDPEMDPNPEPDPDLLVSNTDSHQNVKDPQHWKGGGLMCPGSYLSCHFGGWIQNLPIQLVSAAPASHPTSHHSARMASSPARHRLNCSSTSPHLSPLSWDECLTESGGKGGVQSSRTSPKLFQHLSQPLTTQLG